MPCQNQCWLQGSSQQRGCAVKSLTELLLLQKETFEGKQWLMYNFYREATG